MCVCGMVDQRCAGGYVYRGSYFADLLYGSYIFAEQLQRYDKCFGEGGQSSFQFSTTAIALLEISPARKTRTDPGGS